AQLYRLVVQVQDTCRTGAAAHPARGCAAMSLEQGIDAPGQCLAGNGHAHARDGLGRQGCQPFGQTVEFGMCKRKAERFALRGAAHEQAELHPGVAGVDQQGRVVRAHAALTDTSPTDTGWTPSALRTTRRPWVSTPAA